MFPCTVYPPRAPGAPSLDTKQFLCLLLYLLVCDRRSRSIQDMCLVVALTCPTRSRHIKRRNTGDSKRRNGTHRKKKHATPHKTQHHNCISASIYLAERVSFIDIGLRPVDFPYNVHIYSTVSPTTHKRDVCISFAGVPCLRSIVTS